jgi:peptidoglycan-N-acetylglucosamine deacetylase
MMGRIGVAIVFALVLVHANALGRPALAQTDDWRPIVAMELDNEDLQATPSLQAHGSQFTHLFPLWLHLTDASGRVYEDIRSGTLRQARDSGLKVIPVLDNFSGPDAAPDAVGVVLADPDLRVAVVQDVVTKLTTSELDGVNVRFFGMGAEGYAAELTFLEALRSALQPSGRVVIASVFVAGEAAIDPVDLAALTGVVDFVQVLLYPEHEGDMVPGPAASRGFFQTELTKAFENVPSEKLIAGISLIGYDWSNEATDGESTTEIDFPRAMALAGLRGGRITWDRQSGALSLTYDQAGSHHRAYFDDVLTTSNKLRWVEDRGSAGVSFDRIGREDPALWERLANGGSADSLARLSAIPANLPLQIIGDGEVWEIASSEQRAGLRRLTVEPVSGEVTDIEYAALPSLRVIQRAGGSPGSNLIALTFDDGPSREWTPRVLDLLGQYHVPATFFVVGQNALANPDLVRRVFDEGHEVANHTFTHSQVGDMSSLRTRLELNATRDIIASITGHVPRYFRPPYDDNTHPFFADEAFEEDAFFRPLLQTHAYGYMTVGAALDPRDWERPGVASVVRLATDSQLDPPGHVIMLHDAGGDRLQTLQALPLIIEYYRAEGYEFTTISGLLDRALYGCSFTSPSLWAYCEPRCCCRWQ